LNYVEIENPNRPKLNKGIESLINYLPSKIIPGENYQFFTKYSKN
jgi:hypothetical protein